MIKTGSPRTLWDHCIELEAHIRSSTCNDIYMTNGEVPETIMTAYGIAVLLAVCSAICSAMFGFFLPGRTLNG